MHAWPLAVAVGFLTPAPWGPRREKHERRPLRAVALAWLLCSSRSWAFPPPLQTCPRVVGSSLSPLELRTFAAHLEQFSRVKLKHRVPEAGHKGTLSSD